MACAAHRPDSPERLLSAVHEALEAVHDPCSLQTPMPLSIVAMGLVRDVDVDASGAVRVRLAVTSPGCTLFPSFARAASERIAAIPGVTGVDVEVDPAIMWSPADMAPHARAARSQLLELGVARRGVRPRLWQQGAGGPSRG